MTQATLTDVERLALQLGPKEQLALLEHLAGHLRRGGAAPVPKDLHGAWRGRFPDDFDIDSALRQIRAGWQRGDPS